MQRNLKYYKVLIFIFLLIFPVGSNSEDLKDIIDNKALSCDAAGHRIALMWHGAVNAQIGEWLEGDFEGIIVRYLGIPLQYAFRVNRLSAFQALLNWGANVNHSDLPHHSVLLLLLRDVIAADNLTFDQERMLLLLIERGANTDLDLGAGESLRGLALQARSIRVANAIAGRSNGYLEYAAIRLSANLVAIRSAQLAAVMALARAGAKMMR